MTDNNATVEMIEILPEKKRTGMMGKVISSVAFFIGVIICIAFLLDNVSAEEMSASNQAVVTEFMDTYMSGYPSGLLEEAFSDCQYFIIYKISTTNNRTGYYIDFFNYEYVGAINRDTNYMTGQFQYLVNNSVIIDSVTTNVYGFFFSNNLLPYADLKVYRFNSTVVTSGHQYMGACKSNPVELVEPNSIYNINFMFTTIGYEKYGEADWWYTTVVEPEVINSFGNCMLQSPRGEFNVIDSKIPMATNNTPGFECYKLDTKGGIYFYADYSDLITFDYGTTNTSTFSCDFHLDDTVQTVTLDSSSEYYQYDVAYKEAYYSFPITAFVPNYTSYDNVWIENVRVINTYSGHGASFNSSFEYITPIVIVGDPYNDGNLINPDSVVIPGTDYPAITNNEIAENTYLVEFSNKDGLTFSEFHNIDIPEIYEDNTTWVYMDKQTYTFADFIEDFFGGLVPDNLIDYITGVTSEKEAVEKMTDYLYDNAFTLTSDMVIFVYIDGDWKNNDFTSDDLTYWVYYTASGRLRAISQLLNSSNTNISRQLSISSEYFNYAKSKLNTIDKNLYEFANSQIGFNNTFVSKLDNIDTILGRIEALLKKILDALASLHLEQLDSIDMKLSTIISNMGNGGGGSSLNNDWYNGFRAWLYSINDEDVYLSPHEYFRDNFGTITEFYNLFSKEDFYYTYIVEFFDAFKGSSNQGIVDGNLIKYIKTGVDDESFNINDNDLYTVGGGN